MKFKEYLAEDLIDEISMGPFGSNIKKDCFTDEGVAVLNGSNLVGFALNEDSFGYVTEEKADSLGKANAGKGDVVITHRGTLGQVVFIPQDSSRDRYIISQSQFRVKCNEKIMPEYMVYYLHTPLGQYKLLSNASQVGVPALGRPTSTFKTITFEIPDINIQKKIISVLELFRKKIDVNNRIINNLFNQARALYKSRFIDFEFYNGNRPKEFVEGKVADIVELHDSKRKPLSGSEREKLEKIYPYYGATSIMDYVDDYLFDGTYLLLGEDGSVIDSDGYPILQYVSGKFWCNNHAHIMTGKKSFSVEELYLLFSLTHVDDIVTGAVQLKISQQNLNKVEVIIPSENALKEFDIVIQPMFSKIRKLRLENENLAKMRDSLLPKFMSGEIDLDNIN